MVYCPPSKARSHSPHEYRPWCIVPYHNACLFIEGVCIAPPTVQAHLGAFHKFKSYAGHIKKHLTLKSNTQQQTKNMVFFLLKNSTYGIALVYNRNKSWDMLVSLTLSIPLYKKTCTESSTNMIRNFKKIHVKLHK